MVSAHNQENQFPNITFRVFSDFILNTFASKISLANVLLILFSLLENPELLNLHARQKYPEVSGEKKSVASSWLKTFGKKVVEELGNDPKIFFQQKEFLDNQWERDLTIKLDKLIDLLSLSPYNKNGKLIKKLKVTSKKEITPVHFICPISMACTTAKCEPYHLSLSTRMRDIPKVSLIKGSMIFKSVYALTGICDYCHTLYSADHESYQISDNEPKGNDVYLNTAYYLKIGTNLWVDRIFSNALLNGMYSFHASANSYAEFWNNSFSFDNVQLSRKQIWQKILEYYLKLMQIQQ